MKTEALHIGEKVRHPQYGLGRVKSLTEDTAVVEFSDGARTLSPEESGLESAEPRAQLAGLSLPLPRLIEEVVGATLHRLGYENPASAVSQLATRWRGGKLVLKPSDPTLQAKEVDLEVFFHKIVLMRNNLRVLEQKINSSAALGPADKVEWQQYLTRCYGSMTTFNLLFKDKEDQF
jgi:hypothetical protein